MSPAEVIAVIATLGLVMTIVFVAASAIIEIRRAKRGKKNGRI